MTLTIICIILALILIGVLFYTFPIIKICGDSMYPTLKDGEYYIGIRVFRKTKCKLMHIYVYKPPKEDKGEYYVIKRLVRSQKETSWFIGSTQKEEYFFVGDNYRHSYDSREYGYVKSGNVVAKLIRKVW